MLIQLSKTTLNRILTILALSPSPYSDETKQKLVRLLYTNFTKSAFVIITVSTLLIYALWPKMDHSSLILWFLTITSVTLLRLFDTWRYLKMESNIEYTYWHRHISVGVVVSALLWSAVPICFMSATDHYTNFFIALVIIGMSAGAITTLAADLRLSHLSLCSFVNHNLSVYPV